MIANRYSFVILYLLTFIQGVAFSTVPAAANFLTVHLTATEYGTLFIPMVIGAILSSLIGGSLGDRYGIKTVLLAGGLFNTLSMGLFSFSTSYPILLVMMLFAGLGFGATVTALNLFIIYFFPKHKSAALLVLYACSGLGTAIGPLAYNAFLWPEDPIRLTFGFFFLFLASFAILPAKITLKREAVKHSLPNRALFLGFVTTAFIYGFIETSFGNWMTLFLHQQKGFSEIDANQSLSIFWGIVTSGRIAIAFLALYVSSKYLIRFLPAFMFAALFMIDQIDNPQSAFTAFGAAGLGCSAFLPLVICVAEQCFFKHASFVSGALIAGYMLGLGLASLGPLLQLYNGLLLPIAFLSLLGWFITKHEH